MLSGLRRSALALAALSSLVLLAFPSAARAGVIVVDISGGGEFTSLPAALASAVDGDTLLIRPGDYSGQAGKLEVVGKGLTLAADGAGPVTIPPITVSNLPRFVLRGITAHSGPGHQLGPGLTASGCQLFAEDCDFLGHQGGVVTGTVPGQPGVLVVLADVVLKDCVARGGKGFSPAGSQNPASPGGPGVDAWFLARVSIYGGQLIGGDGGDIFGLPNGSGPGSNNGGPALRMKVDGSFVAGATLTGGDGGDGDELVHPAISYTGGNGIELNGSTALRLLDVTIVPGQGGIDGNGIQGAPGQTTVLEPDASIVNEPGPFRDYALGAPTPEGDALHLDYSGVPGDTLLIFVSMQPGLLPLPAKQGVWHLGGPLFGPFVMSAPTGSLSLNIPIAGAGLGPDGAVLLYEQVFVKPASGPALLSSPSTHLIVDGSL